MYSPPAERLNVDLSFLLQWMDDYDVQIPILLDWNGDVYEEWVFWDNEEYAPFPREFLIDRAGNFIYMSSDLYSDALIEHIEHALHEESSED